MIRRRVRNAGAAATAAGALALPVVVAVAGSASADDPPPVPEALRQVLRAQDVELARAQRRERRWRRLASRRLHAVKTLRHAMRQRVRVNGAHGVLAGLLCIHGHEGSWTDRGDPFWGGLQMDRSFQRSYGDSFYRALGTADRWPAMVQLVVGAEAYYSGRGFGPWPATSRMCGLR